MSSKMFLHVKTFIFKIHILSLLILHNKTCFISFAYYYIYPIFSTLLIYQFCQLNPT